MTRLYKKKRFFSKWVHKILPKDYNLHMTEISGFEEKLEEKMSLHVLAANPQNIMKKEKKNNYNFSMIITWLIIN